MAWVGIRKKGGLAVYEVKGDKVKEQPGRGVKMPHSGGGVRNNKGKDKKNLWGVKRKRR